MLRCFLGLSKCSAVIIGRWSWILAPVSIHAPQNVNWATATSFHGFQTEDPFESTIDPSSQRRSCPSTSPTVKSRGPMTQGSHGLTSQKEPTPMPLLGPKSGRLCASSTSMASNETPRRFLTRLGPTPSRSWTNGK
jgi:hypothetical protein